MTQSKMKTSLAALLALLVGILVGMWLESRRAQWADLGKTVGWVQPDGRFWINRDNE